MKSFFPDNAVQYFVSYYDYYQPEAYIPSVDKYIEKDLMINDEIDKLRLANDIGSAVRTSGRDGGQLCDVHLRHGQSRGLQPTM